MTADNDFWAIRLTSDKIIPLLGRAWDKYPSNILSYKSYYTVIHLLQNLPKDGKEAIERHLQSAILSGSVFSHYCLGLFYEMFNQQERAFGCFHRAAELGEELLQKLVIAALYYGKFGQDERPGEERYQELVSLVERGWKSAQNNVSSALYYGKLGWNKRPEEERYQELLSLTEKGWESAQNIG